MKKSILAVAGLAAVAGVVGPVAGAFAADGNTTFTDTVKVTVDSACSLTATAGTQTDGAYTATIANGGNSELGSTSVKILCNDKAGWMVKAVGSNSSTTASAGVTDMAPDEANKTPIATSVTFSGATSAWAMKLTAGTGTYAPVIADGFDEYHAVPATATKVIYGSTTDQTDGSTFTTTYKVYISPTQQAGTYTGAVTYTLTHPNA